MDENDVQQDVRPGAGGEIKNAADLSTSGEPLKTKCMFGRAKIVIPSE